MIDILPGVQVRKAIRNLAQARALGKSEEKIAQLDEAFRALKELDLDEFVQNVVSKVPNLDPDVIPERDLSGEISASSESCRTAVDMVLRTAVVQEQYKALSALFNPSEAVAARPDIGAKKIKRGDGSEALGDGSEAPENKKKNLKENADPSSQENSDLESVVSDDEYNSDNADDSPVDSGAVSRKKRQRMDASDSESEPEDVRALIGERPSKNRPGQRTRRKMILQKYGRNALIFQKERERKMQRGKKPEEGSSAVHPSWAAKQRLKAAMSAALKGNGGNKKIRLDGESSNSRNVDKSLNESTRRTGAELTEFQSYRLKF